MRVEIVWEKMKCPASQLLDICSRMIEDHEDDLDGQIKEECDNTWDVISVSVEEKDYINDYYQFDLTYLPLYKQ